MTVAAVHRFDGSPEYLTEEGCYIVETSNTDDDPGASIARARVPAGATTRWHRLRGTTERYLVIAGQGRVEVGDLGPQVIGPGDAVIIPPLARQRITSVGPDDLIFIAICTPRYRDANYEDLGDL